MSCRDWECLRANVALGRRFFIALPGQSKERILPKFAAIASGCRLDFAGRELKALGESIHPFKGVKNEADTGAPGTRF